MAKFWAVILLLLLILVIGAYGLAIHSGPLVLAVIIGGTIARFALDFILPDN